MLTPFENKQRYGLRRGAETVLPALYEAVWPLLATFWGFRQGDAFGVLAADGTVISPCTLPAIYSGFAELDMDEELAAILESDATFIAFMQGQFPGLQTYGSRLCKPTQWWAEVATPHLVNEASEIVLFAAGRRLVLKDDDTWAWKSQHSGAQAFPLLFAAQETTLLTLAQQHEFAAAEVADLLRWRQQLTSDEIDVEFADDDYSLPLELWAGADRETAAHQNALAEVLASSGIISHELGARPTPAFYIPFNPQAIAPSARQACEEHLAPLLANNSASYISVEQLIYLAWLWANGFISFNPALTQHEVDSRYAFATDWFANVPIDALYQRYKLDRLLPLLQLPPQSLV